MALPQINKSSYTLIELLSGKKIGIKPWTVKEEKELLFATEGSEDDEHIKKSIVMFMRKCVDNEALFDTLSNTDYVFLLSNLRSISKGTKIEIEISCNGTKDDIPCKFPLHVDIDLNKHVTTKKFTDDIIAIDESIKFNIKEIPYSVFDKMVKESKTVSEFNFNYILHSIDSVVIDGEVFEEFTLEELTEFLDQLKPTQYDTLIDKFVDAGADFKIEHKVKCGRCGHENIIEFGDMYYFLAF